MAEAGIALAAVGVEDPEGRPPARRAGPVAGHHHLRSLADDIAAEADPRRPLELEPDARGLTDRAGDARGQARRLEDRDRDPRPSGEGRQAAEPIGDAAALRDTALAVRGSAGLDPLRQVDDEQVDRPARQERAGDRDPLVDVGRGHDDEPLGLDAAGNGLDRVEGLGEVQPSHDRAAGLGCGRKPQRDGRPTARQVASERDPHATRQAARSEDGIEVEEAGGEDASRIWLGLGSCDIELVVLQRHGRQSTNDGPDLAPLTESRGSGRAPLRSQGREGRRHVRGERRHGPSIEQMFE